MCCVWSRHVVYARRCVEMVSSLYPLNRRRLFMRSYQVNNFRDIDFNTPLYNKLNNVIREPRAAALDTVIHICHKFCGWMPRLSHCLQRAMNVEQSEWVIKCHYQFSAFLFLFLHILFSVRSTKKKEINEMLLLVLLSQSSTHYRDHILSVRI